MFGHPKDNFFTKKARINFEVYGQNYPITQEAGEKRAPFLKPIHRRFLVLGPFQQHALIKFE